MVVLHTLNPVDGKVGHCGTAVNLTRTLPDYRLYKYPVLTTTCFLYGTDGRYTVYCILNPVHCMSLGERTYRTVFSKYVGSGKTGSSESAAWDYYYYYYCITVH